MKNKMLILLFAFFSSAVNAKSFYTTNRDCSSLSEIQRLAEQGNAEAQNNLGVFYAEGICLTQDNKKAFVLVYKSAIQGNLYAQGNLGIFYNKAIVMPRNVAMSKKWYGKACELAKESHSEKQVDICNDVHMLEFQR